MAGNPLSRQRNAKILDQDGNLISVPRLPTINGSNKPRGWNGRSPAEKAEHLLGMSLDRMYDYLAWPADELDPCRLAAQTTVIRVITLISTKLGIENLRQLERKKALAGLVERLPPRHQRRA